MYAIAVSVIHDLAVDEPLDTDSYVGSIADHETAIASSLVILRCYQRLGYQFTFDNIASGERLLSFTGRDDTNDCNVYIEVQRPEPKTSYEDVARLLIVNTRKAHGDAPRPAEVPSLETLASVIGATVENTNTEEG